MDLWNPLDLLHRTRAADAKSAWALNAAGALAVAVFAIAATGPTAMAAAAKCKNNANQYVACTDKLKARTQPKKAADWLPKIEGIKGESTDKDARRGPRLRKQ